MSTTPQQQQLGGPAPIPRPVGIWLALGVFMVFMQVVIGGVTRLTDSGLSMTEWQPILGVVPPMSEEAWQAAFDAYKTQAKTQYENLHTGMGLSEFKFIYFWEFFHRLWARIMGMVFLVPFLFFLYKGWITKHLVKRLAVVIGIAAIAASVGWIMVASGLNNDHRTWVSAWKLMFHLAIAVALFGYLLWTTFPAFAPITADGQHGELRRLAGGVTALLVLQIALGGLMAGTRAGLIHPHWPIFVHWDTLSSQLFDANQANAESLVDYEKYGFMKAWVQVLHRLAAFALVAASVWFVYVSRRFEVSRAFEKGRVFLLAVLGTQFLLGVLTVVNCHFKVPVGLGSVHQACAFVLLGAMLFLNYLLVRKKMA